MTQVWTINQLSKMTKLSKDTLRFYEKEQLITPERQENNYRIYSEEDLLKIKYISVMKYARFSLNEMKEFLALLDTKPSEECNHSGQGLLGKKICDLERTVLHYQKILDILKSIPYPENYEKAQLDYSQKQQSLNLFIQQLFTDIQEESK